MNTFLQRTGLNRLLPGMRMVDDMGWDHQSIRDCDWVTGCYFLIRREVIEQVGLFDPRYFLYCEEVDLCLSAKRAGWDVTFFPKVTVIHLGGESAKMDADITPSGKQIEILQIESELLFFRKNAGTFGFFMNVLLTVLGDLLIIARRLIRGRKPSNVHAYLRHSKDVLSVVLKTNFGTQPTR